MKKVFSFMLIPLLFINVACNELVGGGGTTEYHRKLRK